MFKAQERWRNFSRRMRCGFRNQTVLTTRRDVSHQRPPVLCPLAVRLKSRRKSPGLFLQKRYNTLLFRINTKSKTLCANYRRLTGFIPPTSRNRQCLGLGKPFALLKTGRIVLSHRGMRSLRLYSPFFLILANRHPIHTVVAAGIFRTVRQETSR